MYYFLTYFLLAVDFVILVLIYMSGTIECIKVISVEYKIHTFVQPLQLNNIIKDKSYIVG